MNERLQKDHQRLSGGVGDRWSADLQSMTLMKTRLSGLFDE
jgi:hypothetical protein